MAGRVALVLSLAPPLVILLGTCLGGGRPVLTPGPCLVIAALVAVAVCFSQGKDMVLAFVAYGIISLQLVPVAILAGTEVGALFPILICSGLAILGGLGIYRLRNPVADSGRPYAEFALPAATPWASTTRSADANSVVGQWRFYCDATGRTVILDFHGDGTYVQTVMNNRGDTTRYPGGTWRLEGANVEVTGYVAAGRETGESITWSLVDTPAGVRLFGGDPGAFFVMTRRNEPA